jgi:hypothetical protein
VKHLEIVIVHLATVLTESTLSVATSRTSCHHRCCSRVDAGHVRSQAPIALAIAYSPASFCLGVVLFFLFQWDTPALCVSICSSRWCQNNALLHGRDHVHLNLSIKGYQLYVVLNVFYSSRNIRAITTLQLQGHDNPLDSTYDLFSSLTICSALAMTV